MHEAWTPDKARRVAVERQHREDLKTQHREIVEPVAVGLQEIIEYYKSGPEYSFAVAKATELLKEFR